MSISFYRYGAILLLGIAPYAVPSHGQTDSSDPEAVALLTGVAQRMAGVDQTSLVTFTQFDRHDSVRTRQFRLQVHYPQPADSIVKQSFLEMLRPEKVAGQKYWSWTMTNGKERKWIFLPGTGKLQEFSQRRGGRNRDFDLSELEITSGQIHSHTSELLEHHLLEGRQVVVVKCTEKDESRLSSRPGDRKSGYKLLWIDPASRQIRKAETYTSRGRLLKRYTVEQTEIRQGWELATVIRIWDNRKKTESLITVDEVSLEPIDDRGLFQPSADEGI